MGNDPPKYRTPQLAKLILALALATVVLGIMLVAVATTSGPPGAGGATESPSPSQSASAAASASPDATSDPSPSGTPADATAVTPSATPDAKPDKPNAAADDACAIALRQLNRGESAQARETLEAADITEDTYTQLDAKCQSTWILASTLTAEEPAQRGSAPAEFGKTWDGFVKNYGTPLASAAGFILAGWLALFVLARLLVELPRMRDMTSDPGSRLGAAVLGWFLILLMPIAAVLIGGWMQDKSLNVGLFPWFWVGALALIGAIALGAWLATIRSLMVVVTPAGDDGEAKLIDSATVVAQLRSLAGGRTKSIELPAGPAVSEVAGSLTELSSATWIAALQKIVLFLVGVTPWTATVVVSSETEATVTVSRNRGTKSVAYIFVQGTGFDPLDKPPAAVKKRQFLIVFIAAEILLQLRDAYPEEFDPELHGASSPTSIALQYIATTWYTTTLDTANAKSLLAAALRADPFNELARYSLEYVKNRDASDVAQLVAFGKQLDVWIGTHRRDDELRQGMILTRAAAARNLGAVALEKWRSNTAKQLPEGSSRAQALEAIRKSLGQLPLMSLNADSTDRKERLAAARLVVTKQALDAAVAVLTAEHPPVDPPVDPAPPASPDPAPEIQPAYRADASLAYSYAAMLVCWNRAQFDHEPVDSLLKTALLVPVYREFAEKDPELTVGVGYTEWFEGLDPTPPGPAPLFAGPEAPAGAKADAAAGAKDA